MFDEDMELEVVAWNSMVMGLAKCGENCESRKLFDKMPMRNTVLWNSMISGYVKNSKFSEAMKLFREMQGEKIRPSEFTMVSLLNASACLGAITQGKWIHDYILNQNFQLNPILVTAYCLRTKMLLWDGWPVRITLVNGGGR
ncbi:hypothetical protein V6N11_051575 [Hibiscus sabdariffa]|uniref:Pentatricopeptide repeat-containing protein n=1 Tax=Hibiscus sabdariffa TaxID=183260 RepID=A0ABR2U7Y0_9ROSI